MTDKNIYANLNLQTYRWISQCAKCSTVHSASEPESLSESGRSSLFSWVLLANTGYTQHTGSLMFWWSCCRTDLTGTPGDLTSSCRYQLVSGKLLFTDQSVSDVDSLGFLLKCRYDSVKVELGADHFTIETSVPAYKTNIWINMT